MEETHGEFVSFRGRCAIFTCTLTPLFDFSPILLLPRCLWRIPWSSTLLVFNILVYCFFGQRILVSASSFGVSFASYCCFGRLVC